MILIESIDGGYRVTVPSLRWTWWVYPADHEIRNNGERYRQTGQPVSPRLTLVGNWTIGSVIDEVVRVVSNFLFDTNSRRN